jgi:hypothetical protein
MHKIWLKAGPRRAAQWQFQGVVNATEGAAANKLAKVLGRRMSPSVAKPETMAPPATKRRI